MSRRCRQPGVTLLELVLVMVIMTTVLAIASPSLRGWGRGSALRDAADEFVAMTRLARTEAVSSCEWYRLCIDPNGTGYYLAVRQEGVFVPITTGRGRPVHLPGEMRIEMVKQPAPTLMVAETAATEADLDDPNSIDFYATGRTQPAQIRLTDGQYVYEIQCAAPAELFEVVNAVSTW